VGRSTPFLRRNRERQSGKSREIEDGSQSAESCGEIRERHVVFSKHFLRQPPGRGRRKGPRGRIEARGGIKRKLEGKRAQK